MGLKEEEEQWKQKLQQEKQNHEKMLKDEEKRWKKQLEDLAKEKDLQKKQEEEKWKKMAEMESWKRQQKLQDDEERWNKEIELKRQKQQQKLKEEEEKWIKKQKEDLLQQMQKLSFSSLPVRESTTIYFDKIVAGHSLQESLLLLKQNLEKEERKKNRVMFQVTVSGIPAKAGYLEENNQLGWFYSNQLVIHRAKTYDLPECQITTLETIKIKGLPESIHKYVTVNFAFVGWYELIPEEPKIFLESSIQTQNQTVLRHSNSPEKYNKQQKTINISNTPNSLNITTHMEKQ